MRNLKILIKIKIVLLVILFTCVNCTKKSKGQYYFSDKRSDIHYKVIHKNDTILYIYFLEYKNNKKSDTSIYIKKTNGYYQIVDNPFSDFKQRLTLSIKHDTVYNYDVLGSLFFCKIKKLDDNTFKTTFANHDSLKYKYRHSIYYDKLYNI